MYAQQGAQGQPGPEAQSAGQEQTAKDGAKKDEEEVQEQYTKKAKEYYNSLGMDNQLLLFFYITNLIFENYFKDNGSYRGLLYDKFGFGPEAYSLGMDSGMFAVQA